MRKNISQYLTRLRSQELLVDGSDLKNMGLKNGPGFAAILRQVRAAAIDGTALTREKQLELAKTLLEKLRKGFDVFAPRHGNGRGNGRGSH